MAADYLNDTGGDNSALLGGPAGYIRLLPDEALKWGLNHMIYVLSSAFCPVRCNSVYLCFKVHLAEDMWKEIEVDNVIMPN